MQYAVFRFGFQFRLMVNKRKGGLESIMRNRFRYTMSILTPNRHKQ